MPEAVKAFLQREILQKAWHKQLLEPSFKAACEEGIILKCGDGVTRRVFPKIILYSADLQEKWVSLCIPNFDNDNNSLVDPTWVDTLPAVPNAPAAWWKKKISQTLVRPLQRQGRAQAFPAGGLSRDAEGSSQSSKENFWTRKTFAIFKVHPVPSTTLWLFCHVSE